MRAFFCDLRSPWQRGTNELIRSYFPKVTDGEVAEMPEQLNGRPRETLDWMTPAETYAGLLEKAAWVR